MKSRILFIVVPLALLVFALATGSVLLWRLFVLSALVLIFSALWTFFSARNVAGNVRISGDKCSVGDVITQEVTVANSSRIPTPLMEICEQTSLPGHDGNTSVGIVYRGSKTWNNKIVCQRRGKYNLGNITAGINDPLGFFSLQRNLGKGQDILVYPETMELPFFQPQSGSEAKFLQNQWAVTSHTNEVGRVREYVGGDNLNRIHWHSTAHTGQLMVKVFDPDRPRHIPQNRNVWVLLNLNQANQVGVGDGSTAEYGIVIAASLVKKYIKGGKPVGFIAEGTQRYLFTPETGDAHLWRIMESLALVKSSGTVTLDRLVAAEADRLEASSGVIIITPSTAEGLTAALRPVIARGSNVIVMLLDAISFGGAASSFKTASALSAAGAQVYIIRRGLEMLRSMDTMHPVAAHAGDLRQR